MSKDSFVSDYHPRVARCLVFDGESRRAYDDNGYLHVQDCPVTKEQVVDYFGHEIPGYEALGLEKNKLYPVYRPAGELEKSVALWNGLPLLIEHKTDSAASPQKNLRVGALGSNARFDAPYLRVSLSLHDKDAINGIETGEKRELSGGYTYTPVKQAGTFEGKAYHIIMTDIRPNHVALCKRGRAGGDVSVSDQQPLSITIKESFMSKWKTRIVNALKGKKMTFDGEPDQVAEQVATEVAEIVEAVVAEELEAKTAPAAESAGSPNEEEPPVKDSLAEKLKTLLAPLLAGKNEVDGKPVDTFINELATALKTTTDEGGTPDPAIGDNNGTNNGTSNGQNKEEKPVTGDSALSVEAITKAIASQLHNQFRAKEKAAETVRPLVGNISAMAFDSAEEIYSYALKNKGMNPESYPRAALSGIVQGLIDAAKPAPKMTHDEKKSPLGDVDISRFKTM